MPSLRVDGMVRAWSTFWFEPIPPHSYALLRILFGLFGFVTLVGVGDLDTFWSLDGLVPEAAAGLDLKRLLALASLGDAGALLVYLACLTSFVCMIVGFRTAAAVPASFVMALIQLSWNALPLAGAHMLMQCLIFCLIWTDCGAVWSVDAWLEKRRGVAAGEPPESPIAPLRLVRFQIALVYLSSGLWKLYNPLWRDGSALHYVLNYNVFHRFPFGVTPEFEWVLTVVTYVTLLWELGFAAGLWFRRTRPLVLIAGVVIHLGMIAGLEIGPFSFLMLSSYIAFVDPRRVARLTTGAAAWIRAPRASRAPLARDVT